MASVINNKEKSLSIEKRRKVITLKEKLAVIHDFEMGVTKAELSRDHMISESTVRHIIQNARKYKEQGQSASISPGLQTSRNRSITMIEMEHLLTLWIEDCNQKQIPLKQSTIKTKALSLYQVVRKRRAEEKTDESKNKETFTASTGWFDRYKKRSGIYTAHEVVSGTKKTDENRAVETESRKKYRRWRIQ